MAVGREMGKSPPIFSSLLSSSPFLPNLSIILLSPTPFQLRNPLPYNSLPYLFPPDSVQFPSFPFLSSPPLWLLIKVLLLALSLLFYLFYFFYRPIQCQFGCWWVVRSLLLAMIWFFFSCLVQCQFSRFLAALSVVLIEAFAGSCFANCFRLKNRGSEDHRPFSSFALDCRWSCLCSLISRCLSFGMTKKTRSLSVRAISLSPCDFFCLSCWRRTACILALIHEPHGVFISLCFTTIFYIIRMS